MVSNIFYFHPHLGKWSNLINMFQLGWNHQLEKQLSLKDFSHDFRRVSYICFWLFRIFQPSGVQVCFFLQEKNLVTLEITCTIGTRTLFFGGHCNPYFYALKSHFFEWFWGTEVILEILITPKNRSWSSELFFRDRIRNSCWFRIQVGLMTTR